MVERTKYLAIASVTDQEVRIIDIVPHIHQNANEAIRNGLKGTDLTFCNMSYIENIEENIPELLSNLRISNPMVEPMFFEPIEKAILRKKGYFTFNTTSKNNTYYEKSRKIDIFYKKFINKKNIENDIKLIGLELLKYILEKNTSRITLKYETINEYNINRIFIWYQNAQKLLIQVITEINSGERKIKLTKLPKTTEIRPNVSTKKLLLADLCGSFILRNPSSYINQTPNVK